METATAPTTTVPGTATPAASNAAGYAFGVSLVASTLGSAYSSFAAGRENKRIARFNAKMQEIRARDALFRGELAVQDVRTKTRRVIGAQRASLAAQGIALDSGTALALQEDAAYQGELDAITVKNNAFREAFGFQVDAAQTRQAGDAAYRAGVSNAVGTIAGGASNAAGTYYMANR